MIAGAVALSIARPHASLPHLVKQAALRSLEFKVGQTVMSSMLSRQFLGAGPLLFENRMGNHDPVQWKALLEGTLDQHVH